MITARGHRAAVLALCSSLVACAAAVQPHHASPTGPTISGAGMAPDHTYAGCTSTLRFHFDAGPDPAAAPAAWELLRAHGEGRLRRAGIGPLDGGRAGDAVIPVTLPHSGVYHYVVQVEDDAGAWSNALAATVVVDPRLPHRTTTCP